MLITTRNVSADFIFNNIAGVGWSFADAPELYQFVASLKVGDIIYIKAALPSSPDIIVRGAGIISGLVQAARNVNWRFTTEFRIPKPTERNNVRLNTFYGKFHPEVQAQIIQRL